MMFDKPDSRAEKLKRYNERERRRKLAAEETKRLDAEAMGRLRCMNIYCTFLWNKNKDYLSACHIINKRVNAPELDCPENEFTGCPVCHDMADGRRQARDNHGRKLTARQFIIWLLEQHVGQPYFRWHNVYEQLKRLEG